MAVKTAIAQVEVAQLAPISSPWIYPSAPLSSPKLLSEAKGFTCHIYLGWIVSVTIAVIYIFFYDFCGPRAVVLENIVVRGWMRIRIPH